MKMEAKAERMTPIEIYKGVKELSDGELETLLLLLEPELTEEILIRREKSKTELREKRLLTEEELFRDLHV